MEAHTFFFKSVVCEVFPWNFPDMTFAVDWALKRTLLLLEKHVERAHVHSYLQTCACLSGVTVWMYPHQNSH